MQRLSPISDPTQLEAEAAKAGLALACCYSSSEEYEAELIQVRRQAGAYGPRHPRWVLIATVAVAAAMAAILFGLLRAD